VVQGRTRDAPAVDREEDLIPYDLHLQKQPSRNQAISFPSIAHGNHRITESLRLEKTSKMTKSKHQPNTSMPAKPCPKVPHRHIF